MPVFAAAVQCATINDEADMNRLRSVVGNKHVAFRENIPALPVQNFIKEAGDEVAVGLVPGHIVKLYPQNVPVVKHDEPPAIRAVETARTVAPGFTLHPLKKIMFKHFVVRGTLRCYRGDQRYYSAGFSVSVSM